MKSSSRRAVLAHTCAIGSGLILPGILGASHALEPTPAAPREPRAGASPPAAEPKAVFLIATPRLTDVRYRRTVILVIARGGERHAGLIVNRPTTRTMGALFPDQPPSQKVTDPVYAGGPLAEDTLFALVRAGQPPDARSIEMLPGLYFVQGAATLDRIIDERPNAARYYAGLVLWRSGELRAELRRGLWRVASADIDGVFQRDADRLWRERLEQAERTNA